MEYNDTHHFWLRAILALIILAGCLPGAGLADGNGTVRINEFMADNTRTLADGDGDWSDWIELYNQGAAINLTGWRLTDTAGNANLWMFPSTNLAVGSYLVVFASGKNRGEPGKELHTNFKLNADGEYLALIAPDGTTYATEFSPGYPPQHADISYGYKQERSRVTLAAPGAACRATVPVDGAWGSSWTAREGFNDSGWQAGTTAAGYDINPDFDPLIGLDLEPDMYMINGTAYIRVPFSVEQPGALSNLVLNMMYDDGFAAYINGIEVARVNAPDSLAWNSVATAFHIEWQATNFVPFSISAEPVLVAGTNILAIQGLNYGTFSSDFLIMPMLEAEITVTSQTNTTGYCLQPTAGKANSVTYQGIVADTKFSIDRGIFTNAFQVAISSATESTEIRYTLDGTAPTAGRGILYTNPVAIIGTTVLRAAAFKQGWASTDIDTHTYIFPEDVKRQSPNGQVPGVMWPGSPVNGQVFDYGMDPEIVNAPEYAGIINEALLSIPTLSLVTSPGNLFDPSTGIYVNAEQDGSVWERAASIELLDFDGTPGFQIDCGLRIRGGFSRGGSNPKHSFRLFFRGAYGSGTLKYRLFGAEGAEEFEKVDLRTAQNYAWSNESWNDASRNTFVRDVFSRDCQRDMGQPYTRSRYYHLYLNGQYWGLYQTQERPDARYAASYYGGDKDDYDVAKVEVAGGYHMVATDGDLGMYTSLWQAARSGFSSNAAYNRIQGLNPDGTPNPAWPKLLDVDNLIDYMLVVYFTGNFDAPLTLNEEAPNNYYAIVNRQSPKGFMYFAHDSEHSMMDVQEDRTGSVSAGYNFPDFNPRWLHLRLMHNAEYRLRFADRVHRHFHNGGALTPANAIQRWIARAETISNAIVAESARWGDQHENEPYTKTDWQAEIEWARTAFLGQRTGIVLQQFKNRGWYPAVEPPVFSRHGGVVSNGFLLSITSSDTVYYTCDGTDPREAGSGNTAGIPYSGAVPIRQTGRVKARTLSGGVWSAMTEAFFVIDTPVQLRVSEIMYHPASPPAGSMYADEDFEFIELYNIGTEALHPEGVTFTNGISYTFGLDPGYIGTNECVVLVRNITAFATRYTTNGIVIAGEYGGKLDNKGELLVYLDGLNKRIQAFSYSDTWYPSTDGGGYSLESDDLYGVTNMWDQPSGWHPSEMLYGTPGVVNPLPEPMNQLLVAAAGILLALTRNTFHARNENVERESDTTG